MRPLPEIAHHDTASVAAGEGDLVKVLHSRGQRATPQRLVILRELRRGARHVTADEIHRAVTVELPGTSTPTVYATLELLVELGLASRIVARGGAALYDPRTDPHQHTRCRRCGRVDDLDCAVDSGLLLRAAAGDGFHGQSVELVVSGLCPQCAAGPQ
ncbi:MAG: Fur family transcriptional regulator [Solirubrobacteraceae bacterium]